MTYIFALKYIHSYLIHIHHAPPLPIPGTVCSSSTSTEPAAPEASMLMVWSLPGDIVGWDDQITSAEDNG